MQDLAVGGEEELQTGDDLAAGREELFLAARGQYGKELDS
jgi:selenophosphate synthetase-related protein